jgi:two-component system capsular synthesis sensor histidine kinase RcsC
MDEKKYILVLEDEPVTRKLLDSVLQAKGYEVSLVTNGAEALKKMSRRAPDLIISDVCMPEMDGYSFYKELKK